MLPDSGGGKLSENPGGVTPLVCVCQDVEEECRKEGGALSRHMPMSWLAMGAEAELMDASQEGRGQGLGPRPLKAHYSFSP